MHPNSQDKSKIKLIVTIYSVEVMHSELSNLPKTLNPKTILILILLLIYKACNKMLAIYYHLKIN